MLAEVFSHGLIRDFVVAFGTLFNNIKINRRAESGEDSDTIAIPLSYAPQQRYIERITQDLTLDRPVAISLPRMSFEMVSLNYSPERKLNTMQKYHGRRADTGEIVIKIDPRYFRATEVNELLGDSSKAKKKLGWETKISLETLISEMIENDKKIADNELLIKKQTK